YKPKDFDVVWASLPCTEYSMAKTTSVWHIEEANRVSQRTIYILFDTLFHSIGSSSIHRQASSRSKSSRRIARSKT
ncbi:MAG: hypothetical protein ACKPKO_08580, partial [Candidatus Fonsibacter sp.]